MAGKKFQYDESGGTFYYFILSFLALLLVPGTYYWWPRKKQKGKSRFIDSQTVDFGLLTRISSYEVLLYGN